MIKLHKYILLLLFFLIYSSVSAQESAAPSSISENNILKMEPLAVSVNGNSWSLISDSEGIKTYIKEVPGTEIFPLKAITILDAPIEKVLTLMLDDNRAKEWIDLLTEITLIKTYSDRQYTLLYEMASPFPLLVKKRDFLLESNFSYYKKEERVKLSLHSVQEDSIPIQKGYVRGNIYKSEWNFTALKKEGKTLVSLEYHVDPKGLIPKWVVRTFQKSWPHKTLKDLNRYLQENEIETNKVLYEMIPELVP
jgi:hypothetical protein